MLNFKISIADFWKTVYCFFRGIFKEYNNNKNYGKRAEKQVRLRP